MSEATGRAAKRERLIAEGRGYGGVELATMVPRMKQPRAALRLITQQEARVLGPAPEDGVPRPRRDRRQWHV